MFKSYLFEMLQRGRTDGVFNTAFDYYPNLNCCNLQT